LDRHATCCPRKRVVEPGRSLRAARPAGFGPGFGSRCFSCWLQQA
jgi:hypothetical protein